VIKYLVQRKKDAVIVAILISRKTGKYSFVNLSKGHICECEFDSVDEAIKDMNADDNVLWWRKFND